MVNMALGQLFLIWPFADTKSGMVQESPSRSMDKVIVRLPDGMRDRIKVAAEANNRSMNAEVVATLEKTYPAPAEGSVPTSAIANMLQSIEGLTQEQIEALQARVGGQRLMVVKARITDAGDVEFLITPLDERSLDD